MRSSLKSISGILTANKNGCIVIYPYVDTISIIGGIWLMISILMVGLLSGKLNGTVLTIGSLLSYIIIFALLIMSLFFRIIVEEDKLIYRELSKKTKIAFEYSFLRYRLIKGGRCVMINSKDGRFNVKINITNRGVNTIIRKIDMSK